MGDEMELEAIEKLGIELLGVRGYDERGRALHDLPRDPGRDPEGPEPRAWLYNATRAAHGLPAGKLIARADFAALVEATANIRIG